MTRILALDSALARCSAALVIDGQPVARRAQDAARGHAALLPVMVRDVLTEAGLSADTLSLIAVTVGPGSFTGIRAGLALAHGIGLAAGVPVVGVTVGEALAEALPSREGRALWTAVDSRRGRVFLEQFSSGAHCAASAWALDALPPATEPVAVAGDAAIAVAARLAARGADVRLTDIRVPTAPAIATVAAQRLAGALPALAAQPLYVDPPEARAPAGGLRPAPV